MKKLVQPVSFVGGINLDADPRVIPAEQLVLSKNAYPDQSGILRKRPCLRSISVAPDGPRNVITVGVPNKLTGIVYLYSSLRETGLTYLATAAPTQIITAQYDSWGIKPACVFNYLNDTYILAGYPQEGVLVLRNSNSGPVFTNLSFDYSVSGVTAQTQVDRIGPTVACVYKGRVVWGNPGLGKENVILFADFVNSSFAPVSYLPISLVVGTDAVANRGINVDHLRGDEIVAMREVTLGDVSNQLETALLILGKQRVVIATGAPFQTTDTPPAGSTYRNDFVQSSMNVNAGCFNSNAIANAPLGVFWAGQDNVWLFKAGSLPQPIGFPVRPKLRGIAQEDQAYVQLIYCKDKIILGLPTASRIDLDHSAGSIPVKEYYWLDLRNHLQDGIRWYGPMQYGPFDSTVSLSNSENGELSWVALDENNVSDPVVVGVAFDVNEFGQTFAYLANVTAELDGTAKDLPMKSSAAPFYDFNVAALTWQSSTNYDGSMLVHPTVPNGHWYLPGGAGGTTSSTEPVWPTSSGSSVVDGGVTWFEVTLASGYPKISSLSSVNDVTIDVRTKEFESEDTEHKMTLERVSASLAASERQRIYCNDIQSRGQVTENMSTILGTAGNSELAASFPIGLANAFSHRSFRPDSGTKLNSFTHQLQLIDDTGYVIDTTNNFMCFRLCVISGGNVTDTGNSFEAEIETGVYANIGLLCARIQTAMNLLQTAINAASDLAISGSDGLSMEIDSATGFGHFRVRADNAATFTLFPAFDSTINGASANYTKCKNLLSLLGFDTAQTIDTWCNFTGTSNFAFNPGAGVLGPLFVAGGGLGDTESWAVSHIPSTRCVQVALQSAKMHMREFENRSLSNSDR